MPQFKNLILIGRPGSGKSEFINHTKNLSVEQRQQDFGFGEFTELDDFLWLWEKFEEDDIWEAAGYERKFSEFYEGEYLLSKGPELLDWCMARFNAEYKDLPKDQTILIEFARGMEDGGYAHALSRLSDEILQDAAILFINCTYEETHRRNIARFEEALKHSVLAHSVPEPGMIRFGRDVDWDDITGKKPSGYLGVRNFEVPFVTMDNQAELTEWGPQHERYTAALQLLQKVIAEQATAVEGVCA